MNFKTKQILKYLVKHMDDEITFDMLKEKFKLSHMDLVKLTRPLYHQDIVVVRDEEIFATEYSKFFLEDLQRQSFHKFLDKMLWSFVIPITVSVITTLITISLS